jgi:two-component system phosphate regulon sensor histidine kinase PhoR
LRAVETATEAISKHEASSREELRHLQLVASTSTLLLIFSHEVKALLSWLEDVSISLDRVRRKLRGTEADKITEIREEFKSNKDRFLDLLAMTSLISVDHREAEPLELAMLPRVERATRCFNLVIQGYAIDVDVTQIPTSLKVGPMLEAELYAVLLNVLSNAIKAVIAAGREKRIEISAHRRDAGAVLHVRDTGIGLDETDFEKVFMPFVSDPSNRLYRGLKAKLNPEDQYIVGTGSGLGLSIAREILANRDGELTFVTPPDGWKTDLKITIP